ncbi:matrix metalloproteinase-9-like [Asterias rubens]|uniref:matrix metalloproteinase-9-like n=1 Tax=Asterias rubens TaxID=7604 RepID=UPI0014559BAA|nr:matrix metalloproteinase-9-like [Asterias rubens]
MSGSTWFAVWVVCCATLITGLPTVTDDTNEFALNWLRFYGYLYSSEADDELSIADVSAAIRRMQAFASLPETGVVDSATLEVMNMPRCGVPDFEPDEDGQFKRYTTGSKWPRTALTYKFESYTRDLSVGNIKSTVAASFKQWSDVCPLTFTLVTGTADIIIKFVEGWHGDGNAFDGMSGILAHAFYPASGFGGDLHYDDAETFRMHSTNSNDIDLLYVTVHEIGHSIGIGHSSVSGAIMYPTYAKVATVKLHSDDINAARAQYGK